MKRSNESLCFLLSEGVYQSNFRKCTRDEQQGTYDYEENCVFPKFSYTSPSKDSHKKPNTRSHGDRVRSEFQPEMWQDEFRDKNQGWRITLRYTPSSQNRASIEEDEESKKRSYYWDKH